jgi:Protein of unknown function (DUF3307)
MTWVEVFIAFVVCHLVGDYLLQTDWQARNKRGGLALGAPPAARRALFTHVSTYTLAFLPLLLLSDIDLDWEVLWVLPVIFIPHLIQDDGRLLHAYMQRVKRLDPKENLAVSIAVDQTFHLLALVVLALVLGS